MLHHCSSILALRTGWSGWEALRRRRDAAAAVARRRSCCSECGRGFSVSRCGLLRRLGLQRVAVVPRLPLVEAPTWAGGGHAGYGLCRRTGCWNSSEA
jgi:hypothetical protein